ncbi:MAG: hypothetical protein JNJ77_16520 [Planctomycetia bacterium]|nr:hypothetical protein [Planctomycetia bacterium]
MIDIPREILPVIDLKNGQVVHAFAGQRDLYQPLISCWSPQAHHPIALTEALFTHLGLREYYVADLDAIERRTSQHGEIFEQLIERGFSLWLDAGVTNIDEVELYFKIGIHKIIISSECLLELSLLQVAVHQFGTERIIFSLDLKHGQLQGLNALVNREPENILQQAMQWGVDRFILLDVANVGTAQGPSLLDWCRKLKSMKPDCKLITGGGVRHRADINLLLDAGADRVLISTWLHTNTQS